MNKWAETKISWTNPIKYFVDTNFQKYKLHTFTIPQDIPAEVPKVIKIKFVTIVYEI